VAYRMDADGQVCRRRRRVNASALWRLDGLEYLTADSRFGGGEQCYSISSVTTSTCWGLQQPFTRKTATMPLVFSLPAGAGSWIGRRVNVAVRRTTGRRWAVAGGSVTSLAGLRPRA
jgi:hypothetical protein